MALRTEQGLSQPRSRPDFLSGLQPPSPLLKRPQDRGGWGIPTTALGAPTLGAPPEIPLTSTHRLPPARVTCSQSFLRRPRPDSSSEGRHLRAARNRGTEKIPEVEDTQSGLGSPKAKPPLPARPENSETTGLRVRTVYLCPQLSIRPEAEAKLSGSQGYEEATPSGVAPHRILKT